MMYRVLFFIGLITMITSLIMIYAEKHREKTRLLSMIESSENISLEGNKLIYKKDNANTLSDLELLANAGDFSAQARLGSMYYFGDSVKVDHVKAKYWLLKAAKGSSVEADQSSNLLGAIYEDSGNIESAIFWYKKAAENGFVDSQINLGLIYEQNNELDKAVNWYEEAAKTGSGDAKYNLGLALYKIDEANVKKTIELFFEAMNSITPPLARIADIEYSLGWIYLNNDEVKDVKKALKLLESSAKKGFVESQILLGEIYETHKFNLKDLQRSQYWYLEAAKQGDKDAMEKTQK